MRSYLYRHYFFLSLLSSLALLGTLYAGRFPFGYSLFVNAFVWGGLVGLFLVYIYFRHRNIWVLYLNLRIPRFLHLWFAFAIYTAIFIVLIALFGGMLGL